MKLKGKEFDFFKEEVLYWAQWWGLLEWDWRILWGDEDDALAWVKAEEESGIAAVFLARNWGLDVITPKNLSKSAFHEVCEVLLGRLDCLARREARDWKVNAATHQVIRRLENVVFEVEYGWREEHKRVSEIL